MSLIPGASLGPYRIVELLGRGGMAAVYKAHDPRLDRFVAIKVVLPAFSDEPGFAARFQREAVAVARLRHANIVMVHDYSKEAGASYLVTEFVDGGTLADHVGTPMPPDIVARVLSPVASALDHAHRHNILHRDVKPSNILLWKDGTPVLSDFGIAKLTDDSAHMTSTGLVIGTPSYQAPEQASGEPAVPATDQYALAVVAYELLTGQVPYSAETPMATLLAHLIKPLPSARTLNPALSEEIDTALQQGLAKKPTDRYPTLVAFAAAIAGAATLDPNALGSKDQRWELWRQGTVPPPLKPMVTAPVRPPIGTPPIPAQGLRTVLDQTVAPRDTPRIPPIAAPTVMESASPPATRTPTPPDVAPAAPTAAPAEAVLPISEPTLQFITDEQPASSVGEVQAAHPTPYLSQDTRSSAPTVAPPVQPTIAPVTRDEPQPATPKQGEAGAAAPGVVSDTKRRRLSSTLVVVAASVALLLVVAVVAFILFSSRGNAWTQVAPMPTKRDGLAAALGSGKRIYVVGGASSDKRAVATVAAYFPETNTWTSLANLNTARNTLAVAAGPEGRIFAIGGSGIDGKPLASVEVYEPLKDAWVEVAPLPTPRDGLAAVLGPDGLIYAIGGSDGKDFLTSVEAYDPVKNTWRTATPLRTARSGLGAVVGPDGLIYAIGGSSASGYVATVEAYNPEDKRWAQLASMTTARTGLATVVGTDKRIYAFGGTAARGYAATVEAYTPANRGWQTLAPMPTPRSNFAALLGPDGRIYTFGGIGDKGRLATAEVYKP